MNRDAEADLLQWLQRIDRKPLVIRGARQVGKTWLVRRLAEQAGRGLIELNFERDPELEHLFRERDPLRILPLVEAYTGQRIARDKAILFLDEIQAAPGVLANLRWFAEEMPELPVIAAGSLLDFAWANHAFSMPVGRIAYLYLEPLSFEEFLDATGYGPLRDFLRAWQPGDPFPDVLHQKALLAFRDYLFVGGMPDVVQAWLADRSWITCAERQQALLATIRDDFAKYAGRVPHRRLTAVLTAIPRLVGQKLKYSAIDPDERSVALKQALDLLRQARLLHPVLATDGVGVPLAATASDRTFKVIHLDIGLVSAALGRLNEGARRHASPGVIEGGLAEQVVGQLIRTTFPRFVDPELFYWVREKRGAEAEVDYLIQHGTRIIPVEVKAGTTGALKSLHLFMALRRLPAAVRFCADPPSVTEVQHQTTTGDSAAYRLLSLPCYLAGQTHRLLDTVLATTTD